MKISDPCAAVFITAQAEMIRISQPVIGDEEIRAVNEVLRSGMLAQGPVVDELERAFAGYVGTKYAVAVNSGTAAIHTGLHALGVGAGDEVITTPLTFVATASPVIMLGAKVVFADISDSGFNIDPAAVERNISSATKAIIPVDLYGQVYDYDRVSQVAEKHRLRILEDACQAAGASQDGKKAGNFGDVAAFSLYATKNVMCGEGGMIVTDDARISEKCRMFRHHGQTGKTACRYASLGQNYRMTDLSAAIALEQLKKIDAFTARRRANAAKLAEGLRDIQGIAVPQVRAGDEHAFNHFTIRVTGSFSLGRDELLGKLGEKGIGCGVYYRTPLHLHPLFRQMGYAEGDFPVAEKVAGEVISLPVHPLVRSADIEHIVESIQAHAQ